MGMGMDMDWNRTLMARAWSLAAAGTLLAGALVAPLGAVADGADGAKKKKDQLIPVEILSSAIVVNGLDKLQIEVQWPATPKKYEGGVAHAVTLVGDSEIIETWDLETMPAGRGLLGAIDLPIADPDFDPEAYDELLVAASVRYDKGESSALDYELASADAEPVGVDGGLDVDRCKVFKPGADLSNCTIRGVNLQQADLHGANLDGATITHGNWQAINLNGATLKGATINQMNFDRLSAGVCTRMEGAKVRNATLSNSGFRHADLLNANFNGSTILSSSVDLNLAALKNTTMPDGSVVRDNGVRC